jgi:hypothetical protein
LVGGWVGGCEAARARAAHQLLGLRRACLIRATCALTSDTVPHFVLTARTRLSLNKGCCKPDTHAFASCTPTRMRTPARMRTRTRTRTKRARVCEKRHASARPIWAACSAPHLHFIGLFSMHINAAAGLWHALQPLVPDLRVLYLSHLDAACDAQWDRGGGEPTRCGIPVKNLRTMRAAGHEVPCRAGQ